MKVIMLTSFGGPSCLQVQTLPDPVAGPGQVLVRVHAAGLNFAEIMARQGLYDGCPKPPVVLGYECAGVVEAVGPDVTSIAVGTRVMAMKNFGCWTDLLQTDADAVWPIPDSMSFEIAAAIPVTYITAYICLFDMGNLRPNQSLLVHMAAGGVGIAATQLARTVPNVRIFGTASAAKHQVVKENGVDVPIDYRTTDYAPIVQQETNNKGVDLILDPLGSEHFMKGYNLLAPLGRQISYGGSTFLNGQSRSLLHVASEWWKWKSIHPMRLMKDNRMVGGFFAGALASEKTILKRTVDAIIALYHEGKVKPVIDSVHQYENVNDAIDRIITRQNVGKVILTPNPPANK
ncbi:Vat1 protein [Capsaspora owczarzaki ATCC 30864]|uniref:Vat1 protein n=1 Tax=Capsaspora owczarzaki (strain ATCC 30864) TaxID=595528 RepID=A0A0D2X4T6_CAPO3|nr:Vat1 protein [Capsaspora owczarzaki ATCC 30864]KJE96624.1 Vat1 protein [Capsaspora owczarzaki ATCC 30864]|eukprot:XP_004344545.2 Vat1 protein [Capsaspora owczarzaki ATCC 30864]